MYGNLAQLDGDLTAKRHWRRTPLTGGGRATITEATLQQLLFDHADILPLAEVDPAYAGAVPVCTELSTRAGPADALYLTPTGRVVLAEFKLWRNPSARREVLGQILDYAAVLASWNYDDLERGVRRRTGRSPFDVVAKVHEGLEEHRFVDNIARRLRRGEFLLLIIGDGIREDVEDIVTYVRRHSGLRFNLALIEAAVYRSSRKGGLIIQPRVLARTEVIAREVVVCRDGADTGRVAHQPDSRTRGGSTHSRLPHGRGEKKSLWADEKRRFWQAVLDGLAFDDPVSRTTRDRSQDTVWVLVEGPGLDPK